MGLVYPGRAESKEKVKKCPCCGEEYVESWVPKKGKHRGCCPSCYKPLKK